MNGYLLVTNSSAGTNEDEAVDEARTVLAEKGPVEVVATGSPDELDEVLRGADGRTVVVAGGDGSLHAVVNALYRLDLVGSVPIGLVPLGTGNDFARGIGIELDPAKAAELVAVTEPEPLDLVLDSTGTVMVNNAHLGVGAEASRSGAGWKRRIGRAGYAVGALSAGLNPDFVRVRVVVDGVGVYSGRVAQVAVANGPNVGGGTELVPGADPSSRTLTVIISRAVGPLNRLLYAIRLRRGEHHLMREVSRMTGKEVNVSGGEFRLSTDGELSGPHRSVTWELLPGALRMHQPRPD